MHIRAGESRHSARGRRRRGRHGAAAPERPAITLIPTLRQPVLGICLGMQLLFEAPRKATHACLGIIPGTRRALHRAPARPVPHMGWNTLEIGRDAPLLAGIARRRLRIFRPQLCAAE